MIEKTSESKDKFQVEKSKMRETSKDQCWDQEEKMNEMLKEVNLDMFVERRELDKNPLELRVHVFPEFQPPWHPPSDCQIISHNTCIYPEEALWLLDHTAT